ncbi:hypothetical protein L7F22_038421 [Adiantum nelumboides]|nr:hypothetical protein [Adiantum nelumboides]
MQIAQTAEDGASEHDMGRVVAWVVWMNEGSGPYPTENLLFGQTTLSRSSSKTALGDDGVDDDFSCPFAVDDVDSEEKSRSDMPTSSASSGSLQQRSPDAAVGALIRILKSALPLGNFSHASAEAVESSLMFGTYERESLDRTRRSLSPEGRLASLEAPASLRTHKRAAEALEELQLYKNLRDLMLIREEDMKRISSGSSASPG